MVLGGGVLPFGEFDPTEFAIGQEGYSIDPMKLRLTGWTAHGNIPINTPYITEVVTGLYQGGAAPQLMLPENIKYVVQLYRKTYQHDDDVEYLPIAMLDSTDQHFDDVEAAAEWVNEKRKLGNVLVHCQAGLNRSSLVVARALYLNGDFDDGQQIINWLREKRGEAALCNPAFEQWVRNMRPKEESDDQVREGTAD